MYSKIVGGTWQPSAAIPTESELVATYGASIGTIRKAVEMLVAEGLLVRNQGRGTFIRRPTFGTSLFRFFRFQSSPSGSTKPEGKILARTLAVPPEGIAEALRLGKRSRAIRLDRLRLVDGRPLLAEEIWLPSGKFAALMKIELSAFGNLLYPLYEQLCGQTIASAQETLTVESANAKLAAKLRIEAGKPVVVIERLALGYDQTPLEWRRSHGPAELFRYQVEIR